MNYAALLEWENLIFELPIVFAVILVFISAMGFGADHDADIDHDVEIQDIDHEVIAETDGEISHDISVDDASLGEKIASALGIGRVPFTIILLCWCLFFGSIGLFVNFHLWMMLFGSAKLLVGVSIAIAAVSSLFITSLVARLVGRFIPRSESYGEKLINFVNREAKTLYSIDKSVGYAVLKDKYNNQQQISVVVDSTYNETIPAGTKITLTSYDPNRRVFTAIPTQKLLENH